MIMTLKIDDNYGTSSLLTNLRADSAVSVTTSLIRGAACPKAATSGKKVRKAGCRMHPVASSQQASIHQRDLYCI